MKYEMISPYGVDYPLLARAYFDPADSVVLRMSTPIGDNPHSLHDVMISDGTNLLAINATTEQLSHLWGQLGKALDEVKGDITK